MHMHLSPVAAVAAAFVVLLSFALITIIHAAGEQGLSLPPLWTFSADLSLPSSTPSSLNSYSQLAPFSLFVPILSSPAFASGSKGFSFGFLSSFESSSSSPSQISLSICLGVQHSSSNGGSPFLVPVWNLNTTTLLKQQGRSLVRLQVDENKQLSLVDGDGSVVWALSAVNSMKMESNGNLVIFDSRNGSIWESFEHPSDCLLQGQKLKLGMELTSSNNMYKVAMQAGGIVFYQVSANPLPLVYWIVAVNMTVDVYFDDLVGEFSLDKDAPVNLTASLALDYPRRCAVLNNSLAYFLVDGDRYVMQDACANIRIMAKNTTAADLFRLDADGMVREYYVQQLPNSSYAYTSPDSNRKPCFSPNVCGAYGICSLSNTLGTAVSHNCRVSFTLHF